VRVLVHTDVTKYLEFKAVDGSFVFNKARVEKVRRCGQAQCTQHSWSVIARSHSCQQRHGLN
jgi:RAB protein geranylgeranyltransferase component A